VSTGYGRLKLQQRAHAGVIRAHLGMRGWSAEVASATGCWFVIAGTDEPPMGLHDTEVLRPCMYIDACSKLSL